MDLITNGMDIRLNENDKRLLMTEFTPNDVKTVVVGIHPDKAPGADGLNVAFFRHYWDILGPDVTTACHRWIQNQSFPTVLNETILVLITKVYSHSRMHEYRPITLCNVLYKILSKMLVN